MLGAGLAIVIYSLGDSLPPVAIKPGQQPFLTALTQLGILYIVALFVERSLEVVIKAWRQGEKSRLQQALQAAADADKPAATKKLEAYRAGTQWRALLLGFTLAALVSLAGVRLLGPIFEFDDDAWSFQQAVFRFTDIVVTAGLIAGGSATIHELMALIDGFLRKSRQGATQ